MRMLTLVLVLVLLCGGVARGEWLVDGPWVDDQGSGAGLAGEEKLAVKLVIDRDTAIESIESLMATHRDSVDVDPSQGNWQWAIYSNGTDNWPSQRLLSKTFYAPESPAGQRLFDWRGIHDTGWTLNAGEYWAVLENIDGVPVGGVIRGTTNRQLDAKHEFARYTPVGDPELGQIPVWTWRPSTDSNYSNYAVRIAGHAVPEPSGLTLTGAAIAIAAYKRNASKRRV